MKIVINGKFLTQRVTGVQRFAREILECLDNICHDIDISIAVPKNAIVPNYKNIKTYYIGHNVGVLWEQFDFPRFVKKQKSVSLNLCNSAPLFGKKIVVIHDVKIKAHPEFFNKKFLIWYNFLFKNITKKSKTIITVSEFSKSEIMKYYKVSEDKIFVIYNGWQHFEKTNYDDKTLDRYDLKKDDFYFAMSSLEPNKNFKWILECAKKMPQEKFVIAGGINAKVFASESTIDLDNVQLLGYIKDEEAKTLMRDCKCFLYPTFYEGFGIPPIEAISAGCKSLIVSDTEVMHEILGCYATYCNPYIVPSQLCYKRNANIESISRFSWHDSALKLIEILRS